MDQNQVVKAAKIVARFVVGSGASGIAKSIIETNAAAPETTYRKLTHWAGSLALGALAAEQAKDVTSRKIDWIAEHVEKTKVDIEVAVKKANEEPVFVHSEQVKDEEAPPTKQ